MSYKIVDENSIISLADAIRLKGGTSASLVFPSGFVSAIEDISAGGGGYTIDDIATHNISGIISGSASSIKNYAFAYCSFLTSINFSQATSIGIYAFVNCTSLTSINLPQATSIGSYAYYSCGSLTTINLPQATSIGNYAFGLCYSLTSTSLPQVTTIGGSAFQKCYNLLSLYLLGSSIPTLNIGAFTSTPISNYTTSTSGVYGSIFVPASLYNSYITATNWSVYSARIVSV